MGIALLLGKVFLLLKTFVILSSNNWCFLFFHMTMFDKYLVVLFLYFCHLHSQLHLQHDCPGSWILRWLVVSTWCLFFIIIVDFFLYGLLIVNWTQFLDFVYCIYVHTLWLFQLSFGQMAVGFMAMAWWVFLYSLSLPRSLSLSLYW